MIAIAGTKISISWSGTDEITAKLEELGRKANKIIDPALEDAAEPVLDEMLRLAPVRTGRGKNAITKSKPRTVKGNRSVSVGVHKEDLRDGQHMYYQEYGTSRHAAQPFIRPSLVNRGDESRGIIRDRLKEGLIP